jgi:hypothetical protein
VTRPRLTRLAAAALALLLAVAWHLDDRDARARKWQTCTARGGITTYYCPHQAGNAFAPVTSRWLPAWAWRQ